MTPKQKTLRNTLRDYLYRHSSSTSTTMEGILSCDPIKRIQIVTIHAHHPEANYFRDTYFYIIQCTHILIRSFFGRRAFEKGSHPKRTSSFICPSCKLNSSVVSPAAGCVVQFPVSVPSSSSSSCHLLDRSYHNLLAPFHLESLQSSALLCLYIMSIYIKPCRLKLLGTSLFAGIPYV